MRMRFVVGLALAASSALVMACGGGSAPAEDAAHEGGHTGGRVFFVSPKEGATVKSPVQLEFGSDMFTIAAVPAGEVTTVRAGTGHFHLGVDTDCLPEGAVIPKADPWIHFGDGKNVIEMQLTPGPHKLAVQAGDDKHATMAGLCETINVTVTE
jgi:hypothetical protein